jgi:hypothetical protein
MASLPAIDCGKNIGFRACGGNKNEKALFWTYDRTIT